MTAVANTIFTAAQFNTNVRDNLNETAPAKATTPGAIFVATGTNAIAERYPNAQFIGTTETTASTSFVDLATVGPSVTSTTGSRAIVLLRAAMENSTTNESSHMGFAVSGASTAAATLNRAITMDGTPAASRVRIGMAIFVDFLVAGVNTFTAQYSVSGGTGTFLSRELSVIPL